MKAKNFLVKTIVLGLLAGSLAIANASAGDIRVDVDVRPVPVKTPPPVYPSDMKRDGMDGTVAVKLVIDEKGAVVDCSVAKSSNVAFEQAALDAVKRWKFKPATKDGVAVSTQVVIPIRFTQEG